MGFKILIYLITITFISTIVLIVQHETSHKVIYQEAGCNNISINYFNSGTATTTANCNLLKEMDTALFLAQANVESNYEFQRFDVYFLLLIIVIFIKR